MFAAIREKRFAVRLVKRLLAAHSAVHAEKPDLSGTSLYKEVLLRSELVDPSRIDAVLWEAEDSVDEWTTRGQDGLGFRQLAHYVIISRFRADGHEGTIASIRKVVYSRIPADL